MITELLQKISGADRNGWPEAQATVSNIDQPYVGKLEFLSRITFSFQDAGGQYHSGNFDIRTADLPEDLATGSVVAIHYSPKNPDKTWSGDDYWRESLGVRGFLALLGAVVAIFIALVEIYRKLHHG